MTSGETETIHLARIQPIYTKYEYFFNHIQLEISKELRDIRGMIDSNECDEAEEEKRRRRKSWKMEGRVRGMPLQVKQ